jgi:hypothetical protein
MAKGRQRKAVARKATQPAANATPQAQLPLAHNNLPRLELPRRWELLRESAAAANVDPAEFVERVDTAADRIDRLLKRVSTGGGGLFEVVLGLSGSGKTTFLNTLPKFFERVRIQSFPREQELSALPAFIRRNFVPNDDAARIVIIDRRDNPTKEDLANARSMLSELLVTFREREGKALVLWPITDGDAATAIASSAWSVGRDSVVDAETRGVYRFEGIPKERYFSLADATSKSLTSDGLEAFGVTESVANEMLAECETISDFFGKVDRFADANREATWSVLKAKFQPHLWVVLAGDDGSALKGTVSALTQGLRSRVDIERITEAIDRPGKQPAYIADWKTRRGSLAQLLRAIDARLIDLPPNVVLAAVRSFGEDSLRALLKQPSTTLTQSKEAMRSSRLYKAILSEAKVDATQFAGFRETRRETKEEYLRIQASASNNDKPLNKALGALISACLADDAPALTVITEKRDMAESNLQPDIRIELSPGELICIEPTWRSTGDGLNGERDPGQNTLSEAYLQPYLLAKAMQYVKTLGL